MTKEEAKRWLKELIDEEDKIKYYVISSEKSEKEEFKSLTPDQKRLHWEAYAKKTERQEEMFKRVFNDIFGKQAKEISDYYERHGELPPLNDEETAKRFEPAMQLVYEDAFEGAI